MTSSEPTPVQQRALKHAVVLFALALVCWIVLTIIEHGSRWVVITWWPRGASAQTFLKYLGAAAMVLMWAGTWFSWRCTMSVAIRKPLLIFMSVLLLMLLHVKYPLPILFTTTGGRSPFALLVRSPWSFVVPWVFVGIIMMFARDLNNQWRGRLWTPAQFTRLAIFITFAVGLPMLEKVLVAQGGGWMQNVAPNLTPIQRAHWLLSAILLLMVLPQMFAACALLRRLFLVKRQMAIAEEHSMAQTICPQCGFIVTGPWADGCTECGYRRPDKF